MRVHTVSSGEHIGMCCKKRFILSWSNVSQSTADLGNSTRAIQYVCFRFYVSLCVCMYLSISYSFLFYSTFLFLLFFFFLLLCLSMGRPGKSMCLEGVGR